MRARLSSKLLGYTVFAVFAGLTPLMPSSGDPLPGPEPSADQGLLLAQRACQGCHVISDAEQSPTPAGIPTFRRIANRPDQTADRITRILIKSHRPMPDMHLTRDEILDIIAYLDKLRTDGALSPLLPPGKFDYKPITPEPS